MARTIRQQLQIINKKIICTEKIMVILNDNIKKSQTELLKEEKLLTDYLIKEKELLKQL